MKYLGITLICFALAALINVLMIMFVDSDESNATIGVRLFSWWFILECIGIGIYLLTL